MNTFTSIFNCYDTNINYHIKNYQCNGIAYYCYVYISLSIIGIIILISISYFTISICYENTFQSNNFLSKQTSFPEILLLILKLSLVINTEIIGNNAFFVYFYCFLSICLLLNFLNTYIYYNKKIRQLYLYMFVLIFWNSFCLFLIYLFTQLDDIGLILLILDFPLCGIIVFYNKESQNDFVLYLKINSPKKGFIVISELLNLTKEILNNNRKSTIIFDSYIDLHISDCNEHKCPLKMYNNININGKKENFVYYILQYFDKRYKQIIEEYLNNSFLKAMYSYFLYFHYNKKALALSYLYQAENQCLSLHDQLNVY